MDGSSHKGSDDGHGEKDSTLDESNDKMSVHDEERKEAQSVKYQWAVGSVLTLTPMCFIIVIGFVIELCVAFNVIFRRNIQIFRLFIYTVGVVGMFVMLVLQCFRYLTLELPGKGAAFNKLGIFVLGSGGMIFQGIALYGVSITLDSCKDYLGFSVNFCALLFSALQICTLIRLQRIRINKNTAVIVFSRIILAHMVAANICLWLMTIIEESLEEITGGEEEGEHEEVEHEVETTHNSSSAEMLDVTTEFYSEPACTVPHLVELIIPYTYPFLIEFCILAAGLFFTTWERCGMKPRPKEKAPVDDITYRIPYHNSSIGLLLGWVVILSTVIFVIICLYNFYVDSYYSEQYGFIVYGYNMALSVLLLLAVLAAWYSMTAMKSSEPEEEEDTHQENRDHSILVITFVALICYKIFSLVAGIIENQIGIIVDGVFSMLAGLALTLFINYYIPRKSLAFPEQRADKPGRQCLELMRCLNFALWLGNTFLLKATSAKGPMEEVYGDLVWAIISNIVQPLTILFHFHAMMCLSDAVLRVHVWHGEPLEKKKGDESSRSSVAPIDSGVDNGAFIHRL